MPKEMIRKLSSVKVLELKRNQKPQMIEDMDESTIVETALTLNKSRGQRFCKSGKPRVASILDDHLDTEAWIERKVRYPYTLHSGPSRPSSEGDCSIR
jgi:hypothetical protein